MIIQAASNRLDYMEFRINLLTTAWSTYYSNQIWLIALFCYEIQYQYVR